MYFTCKEAVLRQRKNMGFKKLNYLDRAVGYDQILEHQCGPELPNKGYRRHRMKLLHWCNNQSHVYRLRLVV